MAGWHLVSWVALALVATACIVDEDDPCGTNQHRVTDGYKDGCVCDEAHIPNANGVGCRACGKHEKTQAGMCVCEAGYARANASAECITKEEDGSDAGSNGGSSTEPGTRGQDMPCTSTADCA